MTSNEVSGSSLSTSVSGHITSFWLSSARGTDDVLQFQITLYKTTQKAPTRVCVCVRVCSRGTSSKPLPSTSSEPVDNRSPIQEGEQTIRNLRAGTGDKW